MEVCLHSTVSHLHSCSLLNPQCPGFRPYPLLALGSEVILLTSWLELLTDLISAPHSRREPDFLRNSGNVLQRLSLKYQEYNLLFFHIKRRHMVSWGRCVIYGTTSLQTQKQEHLHIIFQTVEHRGLEINSIIRP